MAQILSIIIRFCPHKFFELHDPVQNDLHVIVHGHKNMRNGQRISVRKSIINFECDITLDRHSREKEGLNGPGAGVTIIRPDKKIIGISTDHPYIKVFDPDDLSASGA